MLEGARCMPLIPALEKQPGLYSKFKDRKGYIVSKQTDGFKVAEGPIEQMSSLEWEEFTRRQL